MKQVPFEELIERKRDGHEHTPAEVDRIVEQFTSGTAPDYQMAAWLMAVLLRGMSAGETIAMTEAVVRSGHVIDLSPIPGIKIDKHSTGGVADTTTLVLAPLVAACGVPVAKMSGRGLGYTGGTLDKLSSIPGFRTELSETEFLSQVQRTGVAVMAQSASLAPADKKIYALRDVTGTVPSIPLIVSSILAKKIAGGADGIVLDVKVGTGAFMKTEAEGRLLAHELTVAGRALGRTLDCVMSDMDQPLGMAVGNALEIEEAARTLRRDENGHDALESLCIALGAKMLVMGGKAESEQEAEHLLRVALTTGAALERFETWIAAQGGDPRVTRDPSRLPRAQCVRVLRSKEAGYVTRMDAEMIGRAAMSMGAGRTRIGETIDPGAGVVLGARVGDYLDSGDVLFSLHAASESLLDIGEERLRAACGMSPEKTGTRELYVGLPSGDTV